MLENLRIWTGLLLLLSFGVPTVASGASLSIFYSGDMNGELEACGCPGGRTGGFARRVTLLERLSDNPEPSLVLDAGNVFLKGGLRVQPEEKPDSATSNFIAALLVSSGTSAVAVGPRDLWAVGVESLKELSEHSGVPWLSANLVDSEKRPVFLPSLLLKVGDATIGVIGATDPISAVASRENLAFSPLVPSVKREAMRLEGKVDLLLVLSNLSLAMNEELRRSVPELDLILAGPSERAPTVKGPFAPWLLHVGGEGRFLGRIELRLGEGAKSALRRSTQLEKRVRSLEVAERSLKELRALIIDEEGHFDQERYAQEGAFLMTRVEKLRAELRRVDPASRIFGYRQEALGDHIPEDPTVRAQIRAFLKSRDTSAESGTGK